MKYLRKFENHTDYEAATLDLPNVSYCVQQNEVHYNPKEYEYVDLGLPSGLLWATMNIGANSETDYGLYFAWGEIMGYSDTSTKAFSWSDYKYSNNGGSTAADMKKYNSTDGKTTLDLEDDAAHINMGGNWRMPTEAEFEELINNTTSEQVTNYNGSGINGRLLTSKTDSSKKLFFSNAGLCSVGSVNIQGSYGYYWSSSLYSLNIIQGRQLFSADNRIYTNTCNRSCGLPIRGVIPSQEEEDDQYPYSAILNPTDDFTQKPKVTIFSDKPIHSQRVDLPIIYFEDTYDINFTYSNDSYYGNNTAFIETNSNYIINVNYPNGIIKTISGVAGIRGYYYEINENGIEFSREIRVEPL